MERNKLNIFVCALCGTMFCATDARCARELCHIGYYVSKCDNFEIGTNILKSLQENEGDSPVSYYDWSGQYNVANLRNFFDGKGPIIFYNSDGTGPTTITNQTKIVKMRNRFLNEVCADAVDIVCTRCPGNGSSQVSFHSGIHVGGSSEWNFVSFANCFMNKFTDNTGTYTMSNNSDCYYSREITGNTHTVTTTTASEDPQNGIDAPGNSDD